MSLYLEVLDGLLEAMAEYFEVGLEIETLRI